jgi:hypothetical protein
MSDEPTGADPTEDDDRFTVLEVFGLKLEVSNPHLADLLTMDAGDALKTDVKDLRDAEDVKAIRAEAQEAVPDVVIAPQTPHDDNDAAERKALRDKVQSLGESMGFTTHVDGVWESPSGIVVLTRVVERSTSFAGASHFVEEVAARRAQVAGEEATALFVVADQQTADVFKVAIRQARLYHQMRTVSLDNLTEAATLYARGMIDHSQAVILLAPVADIDVGEILSVIRSVSDEGASG